MSILTVEQVAERLKCTPETVRENTPHRIPGAKFGRDWVYSESLVLKAVEAQSLLTAKRPARGPAEITKSTLPSLTL